MFSEISQIRCFEISKQSGGSYYIIDTGKKENISGIVKKCHDSNFVFIGNEAPIINGLANELRLEKILVIGPNKEFALEGSKYKTRLLLEQVHPSANPKFYFIDPEKSDWKEELSRAIKEMHGKVAIKPIEPKYGKGVIVEGCHFSSIQAYERAFDTAKAGPFLIEEKIIGEEWSGQCLCDSKHHTHSFYASRDFKRALENDKGENTGGVATMSDNNELLPFMKKEEFEEGEKIVRKIVEELSKKEGYEEGFLTGVKYPAFVLPGRGNKIFEHNDRFGDPEGLNALAVLKNDFVDVCFSMLEGNLQRLEFDEKAVTTLYTAPLTYGNYMKKFSGSKTIRWNEKEFSSQTEVYPGSVELTNNGEVQILSSRSVAVVSKANTLEESLTIANEDVKKIDGPVRHRTDIDMDYVHKCVEDMKKLRKNKT